MEGVQDVSAIYQSCEGRTQQTTIIYLRFLYKYRPIYNSNHLHQNIDQRDYQCNGKAGAKQRGKENAETQVDVKAAFERKEVMMFYFIGNVSI